MAAPSSTLAWRVPGTEGPGGCSPQGPQRVGRDRATRRARMSAYSRLTLPYGGLTQLCEPAILQRKLKTTNGGQRRGVWALGQPVEEEIPTRLSRTFRRLCHRTAEPPLSHGSDRGP